ncbi:hypothetical protein IEO21_06316 [Rhodonia placenta]|uniref:Uncharacterized protein n=1 Tax=Rhodonia placenta TaxID=104341 RepID=A0A8H7P077_9APHY|nr:hypothetical protein IEO21_06316 [Postia placenta]
MLKHANPRDQEQARKLGRASSRGPEAPIVVYNNPARSRGQTCLPCRRTGCSNKLSLAIINILCYADSTTDNVRNSDHTGTCT